MSSSRLRSRRRSRNFTLIKPTIQTPQRDGAVPASLARRNRSTAKPAGFRARARARQYFRAGYERRSLIVRSPVYLLDPLTDPRWPRLVLSHPSASISHTPEWLAALHRTYGYQPIGLTTSKPGEELRNGLVFCRVNSWLTGSRIVSLPFSDHCEPLVSCSEELQDLLHALLRESQKEYCRRVEIRPVTCLSTGPVEFEKSQEFFLHRLDLRPGRQAVFQSFHRDCVRRKIRRAEREGLNCEEGRSELLLREFYSLQVISRRRHQLPPQPLSWFRNLIEGLGDQVSIQVASKGGQPVAAIMTLRFRNILTYKYGCSDQRFHRWGGMQLLLWKAIEKAIAQGLREFDMGRSDLDNPGLATFKDRWGAVRSKLTYWACPALPTSARQSTWKLDAAKKVFAHTPSMFLTLAGNLLYKHIG